MLSQFEQSIGTEFEDEGMKNRSAFEMNFFQCITNLGIDSLDFFVELIKYFEAWFIFFFHDRDDSFKKGIVRLNVIFIQAENAGTIYSMIRWVVVSLFDFYQNQTL